MLFNDLVDNHVIVTFPFCVKTNLPWAAAPSTLRNSTRCAFASRIRTGLFP